MSADDDKLFADAWIWVWTRFLPSMLAIGLICFAVYSCGEILTAPRNYIYYGNPAAGEQAPPDCWPWWQCNGSKETNHPNCKCWDDK